MNKCALEGEHIFILHSHNIMFRYSYLTVEFGSIIHNAFDRGAFQNFIDFFEIDYFGFKPLKVDWRFKLGTYSL